MCKRCDQVNLVRHKNNVHNVMFDDVYAFTTNKGRLHVVINVVVEVQYSVIADSGASK